MTGWILACVRFCPHLLLSIVNYHCQTMPFQGVLSPTIIVKQCPFRVLFLQSSLSNNALSGCSFSNHHCQTMIFQDVLSHFAFLSPPTFDLSIVNNHCQTMPFQAVLSPTIIVKQCPFRVFFLQPSLSNNALSGCCFSNHHCQTMPSQDFLSHYLCLSPPTFEHCQSSLSNNALSGFPFSFCVSVPT